MNSFYKRFEIIKLEVEFGKNIKNSKDKTERSSYFYSFYSKLYTLSTDLNGYYGGFDKRIVNVILSSIKNKDILEIGCGNGHLYNLIKDDVNSYTGVDIITNNNKYENANFIKQNLIEFDKNFLKDKKFDVIYSNDFIEHLYEEDLTELMEYLICNCLNKNGVILSIIPSIEFGHADSIDYLKFPKEKIFGSHLTLKNSVGWSNYFKIWGGISKIYGGSYKTSKYTKNSDLFFLPPFIHDFLCRYGLRNIYRVPKAVVMKTIFKKKR